ncbi:glycosyltransferase [Chryseobacterium polytrichastri]|uniref:Glycosyltransferase involved in cell wall bisynthesis n=1 Tax=Chryseobacterium polytrichastri TaxID=1302687 RepID=A0A1M6U459_9FLAO|nr:glycosyltransferase [Chryseobacterium polytrichastri]SHK64075.1 Glycosyltransferase involved in cell wall bisynthesis [Chryseobacterium polytrichastri]
MGKSAIFIDSNSIGNFHEVFNAAFFKILEARFENILYLSSKSSYENLKNILVDNDVNSHSNKIEFKEIKVLEGRKSHHIFSRKIYASILLFFLLLKYKNRDVILANLNEFGTLYFNFISNIFKINLTIIAHGELEYLIQDVPKNKPIFVYKKLLQRFFKNKISNNIKIIALGAPIREKLIELYPKNNGAVVSMEHPYFFKNVPGEKQFSLPVKMGIVGAIGENKGMLSFIELSERLKDVIMDKKLELYVIGKHGYKIENYPLLNFITKANTIIPSNEYNEAIKELNAILFFYKQNQYQLTASGAIFDAINHEKPVIAIENNYFNHICSYGKIGYLCEDINEMESIIRKLIKHEVSLESVKEFNELKHAFSWENINYPIQDV